MKSITIDVYKYSELSESAQTVARLHYVNGLNISSEGKHRVAGTRRGEALSECIGFFLTEKDYEFLQDGRQLDRAFR